MQFRKVIVSLYIDFHPENLILDPPLEGETISQKVKGSNNFLIHHEELINRHKKYAESIGADYIIFNDMIEYLKYEKQIVSMIPEGLPWDRFDLVNFFKLSLLEKLAKDYDEIIYIDLDLIPNTSEDLFDIFDLQTNQFISFNYASFMNETYEDLKKKYGNQNIYRHPLIKREATNRILNVPNNKDIYCTFIIGITKEMIKTLNLKPNEDLPLLFAELRKLHNEDPWFAVDNETYLIYKIIKENINVKHIPNEAGIEFVWSLKDLEKISSETKFIHVVSKDFEDVLKYIS